MYNTGGVVVRSSSISLSSMGLIVFLVFLVMKLCNPTNPDFEWLTWFWVWFPLWAPITLEISTYLLVLTFMYVFSLI